MAPSTDSPWPPSFPRDVASTVVASVQHVTSSVRLLLVGCFQCQSLRIGCWRRQEEPDGAWFDCEKLQVEHPFCYVNPVALTEPSSAPTSPPPRENQLPALAAGSGKAAMGRGAGTSLLAAPRTSSLPSYSSYSTSSPCKPKGEAIPNGSATLLRNGGPAALKNGDVHRSSSLVESFAAKLEADIRKLEYDRQRAEGEAVPRAPQNDFLLGDTILELPDYLRDAETDDMGAEDVDFLSDIRLDCHGFDECAEAESEGRPGDAREVWQPEELEDAFECYNMAAFYSYGAPLAQSGGRNASKLRGEKFEEVFPVTFHNNNTIKVYKPASESESPLALPSKDEVVIENETEIPCAQTKRSVSEDQLKEFIKMCVFAENVSEVKVPCTRGTSICDDNVYYCSKSFNKHLIYNLVKSTMSECSKSYSQSIAVCVNYPVHLVQSKVLSVLQDQGNQYEPIPSGLQVFRSNTLFSVSDNLFYQNQIMTERLIENVVIDELKKEDKLWQNVSQEEEELKEAITTEILDDIIGDTTSLFKSILEKKLLI